MKIKFNIIASLYDYNPNLAAFMKVGVCTWKPLRLWCPNSLMSQYPSLFFVLVKRTIDVSYYCIDLYVVLNA